MKTGEEHAETGLSVSAAESGRRRNHGSVKHEFFPLICFARHLLNRRVQFYTVILCSQNRPLTDTSYNTPRVFTSVRKYHDIFENTKISKISRFFRYISDIFDTFDIFKNAPIVRVGLLNKLLNNVKIVKHTVFN